MSSFTLRFADTALETTFQRDHLLQVRSQIRIAILLACILYGSFGILDRSVIPDAVGLAAIIRYVVACPLMLVTAWIVPAIPTLPALQRLMSAMAFMTGAGVVAMIVASDAPDRGLYYVGILIISIAAYTFIWLRFIYAVVAAWGLFVLYHAVMLLTRDLPGSVLATNTFFLVTTNVIGMSAGYTIERQTRSQFLARRTIADQAAMLSTALSNAQELAQRDPLTGAFNRRAFFEIAASEFARADRSGLPLSLAMVDIDHFKWTNDRFGHAVGDRVLQDVVAGLRGVVRRGDLIFRFGGEEFVVILPETDEDEAIAIGDRLRATVAEIEIEVDVLPERVTASVGIATRATAGEPIDTLVDRADTAMYQAKQLGRNRVAVA